MKLIWATLLLFTLTARADFHNYYPEELKQYLNENSAKANDEEGLRNLLFTTLDSTHQRSNNGHDTLGCDSKKGGECYSHQVLGYKGARKVLFGKLHLEKDDEGYFIKDVYCNKEIRSRNTRMGPGTIPNENVINCEHTWPQSKFTGRFPKEMQKSDLHHLYPTDSHANSVRGNYPFEDLDKYGTSVDEDDCTSSKSSGNSFEPPTEHKGNVARALFYFSIRYQIQIAPTQEATLRRWHQEDPVDAEEMERNEGVYTVQKNRNPFVDMPQLVDQISNF